MSKKKYTERRFQSKAARTATDSHKEFLWQARLLFQSLPIANALIIGSIDTYIVIGTYVLSDKAALKWDSYDPCHISFLLFALHTVVLQPAFTCGCPLLIEVLPDVKGI
jgi:hypothetical protein